MSEVIDNIKERGIGEICESSYTTYGKYVNTNRALPGLYDGLKPSYRRMIVTALEKKGKIVSSSDLIGYTISTTHPHGDKSLKDVITQLVRAKIFVEGGNFGYYPIYGDSMDAAAHRYTESGLEPNWYNIFKDFMADVPRIPGEKAGSYEPAYLPTPIPLNLIFGSSGIGIGINTEIPSFSAKSMLDAYLNDDPSLLKSHYNLELDYELSELNSLWETGKGRVVYKYKCWKGNSDDGTDGVYLEGDTNLFLPYLDNILVWRNQGRVFIRDESDNGVNRIFIGRNFNIRAVNQDMIYEEVSKYASSHNSKLPHKQMYRLGIHDEGKAFYIPMKDWIHLSYTNYKSLVESNKARNIADLEFKILVNTHLKQVAELLLESTTDISNQEIADTLNIELDVVNAITRRSIATLKRVDTEQEIANYKATITSYENIDPDKFIKELVDKL